MYWKPQFFTLPDKVRLPLPKQMSGYITGSNYPNTYYKKYTLKFSICTASILDETSDNIGLITTNESTIKLENPGGSSVGGSAALAAYYCNSYPLTSSSPGLVTAVSATDRNSSMLVTGTYSKYAYGLGDGCIPLRKKKTDFHCLFRFSRSTYDALIRLTVTTRYKIRISIG